MKKIIPYVVALDVADYPNARKLLESMPNVMPTDYYSDELQGKYDV